MNPNGFLMSEQEEWESLRDLAIRNGRPLHPAYRYSDWAAFCRAGKPWHNHGDTNFRNLTHGDRWRQMEAAEEASRGDVPLYRKMAEARAAMGIPERGATGMTPSSPDKQIRDHLEGIARNGFKPPPGLSLA